MRHSCGRNFPHSRGPGVPRGKQHNSGERVSRHRCPHFFLADFPYRCQLRDATGPPSHPLSSLFSHIHRLIRRGRQTLGTFCLSGATTKTCRYRGCRHLLSFFWTLGMARYRLILQGRLLCRQRLCRRRRRFEGECSHSHCESEPKKQCR